MASTRVLVVFSIIAAIVSTTLAKEFVVGDAAGWTKGFDYHTWAKDKVFRVGDKLVFKYQPGNHNVLKVNGTGFNACTATPPSQALTTGNDKITLATTGSKWYICGFTGHCQNGQKLSIFVMPQQYMAPPTDAWAPTPVVSSGIDDIPYF